MNIDFGPYRLKEEFMLDHFKSNVYKNKKLKIKLKKKKQKRN